MRVTTKGQVTIPQEIRVQFGFLPDTEVEFVVDGDLVVLVKAVEARRANRGDRLVAHLQSHGAQLAMSTDEIMALTRGDA